MAVLEITLDGVNEVSIHLESIPEGLFKKSLFAEIGEYVMFRVKQRTAQGKDFKGKLFKPYSPSYKLFRKKKGRGTRLVNLKFTGSMLSAMTESAKDDQVRVFFLNTRDEFGGRNPKKAFFLNQDRTFFALSKKDVQGIMAIVKKQATKLIDQ
jgi:hypothetical protein